MAFSTFLESRRADCRALVEELGKHFAYVSVLGSDVKASAVRAEKRSVSIGEGALSECGFVIKMYDGRGFFEYSACDIAGDKVALTEKILSRVKISDALAQGTVTGGKIEEEPLIQSFSRPYDFDNYENSAILDFCKAQRDALLGEDEKILNAIVAVLSFTVSKLFVSKNRELDQSYGWVNGFSTVLYREGEKMVPASERAYSTLMSDVMRDLPTLNSKLIDKARHLVNAKPIVPGVYDVITDPSISGLIAHEAFGHGVEMDQFVKDRALAKKFVGSYVASPICNMRDGAAATLSTASYFFDDDGVLAHDTQIIKDGILVSGLSDLASACQLGCEPSGNGRRESYRRKAYSRMTNTFFEPGKDKLEDMIRSIKHGYMLFETNNGMEDPKNWQIQCTAEYGIEIVDGVLTDNYVSPVVMSGDVPELLKSISMVSDDFRVIGAGSCGKGYKEWVRVSDGGPAMKVRVKLA